MELYSNICNHGGTNARCSMGHLKKIKMGYWAHLAHALAFAGTLVSLGVSGVVHSFIPFLFTDSMSGGVEKLRHKLWQDKERARRNNG